MKPITEKQFRRCSKYTQSWLINRAFNQPHHIFYGLVKPDGTTDGIYAGAVQSRDYIEGILQHAKRSRKHRPQYKDVTIRRSVVFRLSAEYIHIAVDVVVELNKRGWDVALHYGADGLCCCTAWDKKQPTDPNQRHCFWSRNMSEAICLTALSILGLLKPE